MSLKHPTNFLTIGLLAMGAGTFIYRQNFVQTGIEKILHHEVEIETKAEHFEGHFNTVAKQMPPSNTYQEIGKFDYTKMVMLLEYCNEIKNSLITVRASLATHLNWLKNRLLEEKTALFEFLNVQRTLAQDHSISKGKKSELYYLRAISRMHDDIQCAYRVALAKQRDLCIKA